MFGTTDRAAVARACEDNGFDFTWKAADADMDAVRDAIWKNMVFFKWRRGDVLVIDNDAVSRGRMPYAGPRSVAVAWA